MPTMTQTGPHSRLMSRIVQLSYGASQWEK